LKSDHPSSADQQDSDHRSRPRRAWRAHKQHLFEVEALREDVICVVSFQHGGGHETDDKLPDALLGIQFIHSPKCRCSVPFIVFSIAVGDRSSQPVLSLIPAKHTDIISANTPGSCETVRSCFAQSTETRKKLPVQNILGANGSQSFEIC
jgi:hypothetical protein